MADTQKQRLRELDFLRGIAVILVLFRHSPILEFMTNMGWIGVDLFFVLSGFLVSGLLFKEFIKFGDVSPTRFLIRRGFKIYPIYYLSFPVYFSLVFFMSQSNPLGWLSEALFVQNYTYGWGYVSGASWSLAVEEHFYFGLAIVLWFLVKKGMFRGPGKGKNNKMRAEAIIISAMVLILAFRIISNIMFPDQISRNFTMTHLRIDSILAGVLVAYLYYFRYDYLKGLFAKTKRFALPTALLLLSFTPFVEPVGSFFVMTIGFTLIYAGFAIILVYFLMSENINARLDSIFGRRAVSTVSRIGVYSYSIYVFHLFVNLAVGRLGLGAMENFALNVPLSILLGALVSITVERYFLSARDRRFPRRSAIVNNQKPQPSAL